MMRARWSPKINVKLQQDHENLNSFVLNDQVCSRFSCPHCVYTCNWVSDLQKHSKGQVRKMTFTTFTVSSQFGRQLKYTERNNTWTIRGLQTCILPRAHVGVHVVPSPPTLGKPAWWSQRFVQLDLARRRATTNKKLIPSRTRPCDIQLNLLKNFQ